MSTAYKTLNTELGLPTQPVGPSAYIPCLASALDVSECVRRQALTLAKRAQGTTIANGRQPSGVAAACLYEAAQEHGKSLTQQRVADAAGLSTVTVCARRDELNEV